MASEQVNYPDVLGTLSKGVRKTLDYIECAVATRPGIVAAGDRFEAILLIQSLVNEEVDVRVELDFPGKDKNNRKGVFSSNSTRLLVGLQPAEAGFVTLPLSVSPNAAPADDYEISIKLTVKRYRGSTGLIGRAQEIRNAQQRTPYKLNAVSSSDMQENFESLKSLRFSAEDHLKKQMLHSTFAVMKPEKPVLASLKSPQAKWVSLWTIADHLDDRNVIDRVQNELRTLTPQLRRETIFKPLLKSTQAAFEEARYPLHVAEAIHITKLITLVVETGARQLEEGTLKDPIPGWIAETARLLIQEPRFAKQGVYLVSKHIYTEILHHTILHGFSMVGTVMKENFGTKDELNSYADTIVEAVQHNGDLDFAHAYLPLVTAGVIANNRVTMPGEQVRDTLHLMHRTLQERSSERTENNGFVFDIATALIDRGLDNF
jgi:hypothetical protein